MRGAIARGQGNSEQKAQGTKKRLQREGLQALYALAENWEEEDFQPLNAGNLGGGRPREFLLDGGTGDAADVGAGDAEVG
jgi:hypothetical protein